MQASTSAGAIAFSSAKRTASNRNGHRSRLTTKPAQSGTSTARLPSIAATACARSRVAGAASAGNASSTSSIRATGLKTWKPTKRSGRALDPATAGGAARLGERVDRERRRGRAEHGAVVETRLEPGEQLELCVERLRDRLDDERAVLEPLRQVGRDPHA